MRTEHNSIGASFCLLTWLHWAGVLFQRHLSAKPNICSIMSQWTEVICVQRWFWETRLSSRPCLTLPSETFLRLQIQKAKTVTATSRRRQRKLEYKFKLQGTSDFSVKQNFHCVIQKWKLGSKVCGITVTCSVSKSSRGLVLPERSGQFGRAGSWPLWCSGHSSLVQLKTSLLPSQFYQLQSLLG